ncbi:plasmid replication protein, CyRepA1 family [Leptospira santarosai]|uniref:plasmid replication protein, CyRepA1 family n=1 Tax=Leptospira santarosai TaxID=28183 RepID=UPI0002973B65|nr:plasmid replication protein, CyRepA1 family [Leptospira santarosai]EKS06768.1 hypothetical protein LEP1GSC071_0280 [Leptospira santarosai str. JET]
MSTQDNQIEEPSSNDKTPETVELFKKAKSALKAIPDDILKKNIFIIVCSLGAAFSYADILKLFGSRLTYGERNNVWAILGKRKHGKLETVFSFAINQGWNSAQSSQNPSEQSVIGVPLHIQKANGYLVKINQRYLSDSLSTFQQLRKITVIQSLQGTGKTELFLKLFSNEQIVYCCPQKELVRQACERHRKAGIDIRSYEDFKNGDLSFYKGNIAICINSLHKLNPDNYKNAVVIFDEADQISNQLQSEILSSQRSSVFKNLESLVQKSRVSIFSSADIPASLLYLITGHLKYKEYNHYFNEYNPFVGRTLVSYSDKNSLFASVEKEISEGNKVCISGLIKNTLMALEADFKKKFPEKKILLLMEDNKSEEAQRSILTDPNNIKDLDVFLFTPIIASGFDISIEFAEKVYFVADTNKTLNHFQGFQMVNRVRRFKELHFFGLISQPNGNTDLYRDMAQIIAENRKKLAEMEVNSHFSGDGNRFGNSEFPPIEIHAMLVSSETEASRNGLRDHFIDHCNERKFLFSFGKRAEFDFSTSQQTNLSSALSNEISEEGILSARDISISEAIDIKNGRNGTLQTRLELERYRLQKIISFRPGDPGSIKDLRVITGKSGSPILKYSQLKEYFISQLDSFDLEILESEINKSGSEANKDPIQMRGIIYKELLQKFPMRLRHKFFEATDLVDVARYLYYQRDKVNRYLSIQIDDSNKYDPLETFGQVLRRFGLGVTMKTINNVPYMRINAKDLSLLVRSFRRWWNAKKDFFLKKHMLLS